MAPTIGGGLIYSVFQEVKNLNNYWKSYPLEKALIQLTYYLTQGSKLIESDLGTILRHPLVALRLDVTII